MSEMWKGLGWGVLGLLTIMYAALFLVGIIVDSSEDSEDKEVPRVILDPTVVAMGGGNANAQEIGSYSWIRNTTLKS